MLIRHFREIEPRDVEEGAERVRIRQVITESEGAPHFVMRVFEILPGGFTPKHSHAWEHEVFILSGKGHVLSAEGLHPIQPGDVVFIPGNELHQFQNSGDRPLEFICLIPTERVCAL